MPHFGLVDGQMSASEKEQAVLVIMHPLGQDTTYFIIHCTLIVPGRERKALSSHKVAFATRYATMDGITECCPEITLSFLSSQAKILASKMSVDRLSI